MNDIADPSLIRAGDKLRVLSPVGPLAGEGHASRADVIHVVREGETLWGIAKHYGVDLKALQSWNSLSNNSIIRPGDELKVVMAH